MLRIFCSLVLLLVGWTMKINSVEMCVIRPFRQHQYVRSIATNLAVCPRGKRNSGRVHSAHSSFPRVSLILSAAHARTDNEGRLPLSFAAIPFDIYGAYFWLNSL